MPFSRVGAKTEGPKTYLVRRKTPMLLDVSNNRSQARASGPRIEWTRMTGPLAPLPNDDPLHYLYIFERPLYKLLKARFEVCESTDTTPPAVERSCVHARRTGWPAPDFIRRGELEDLLDGHDQNPASPNDDPLGLQWPNSRGLGSMQGHGQHPFAV